MPTLTAFATSEDGRLESSDLVYLTARAGGGVVGIDTNNIVVGQRLEGATYRCWESFLSFDTSSIPDDATIDSVVLSLFGDGDFSSTDFTLQARLRDWGATLTTTDYVPGANLAALTLLATVTSVGWSLAAYNDFTSEAAFAANINKTGETRLVIVSSRLVAGNVPTGLEFVTAHHSETSGTTNDPKLVVNYTEAGAGGNNGSMMRGVG